MTTQHSFWRGRSVLLTGHTGFKGGWLALWLHELGAKVHGFALDPPTQPNFFEVAKVAAAFSSDTRANLSDLPSLKSVFERTQPEIVFHLAAQPLVRESYRTPLKTFTTNVMGTANVLEAIRATASVRAAVIITTDKVYENKNTLAPYTEQDALGGHDPYSASKAAAEIVTASYRASFFATSNGHAARIASARAGNVIGGGDWAVDRLVPDCLRSFTNKTAVHLRYPHSVRPWQHVLEPLLGYLRLAERLLSDGGEPFARAWNFGPDENSEATVGNVADLTAKLWGESAHVVHESSARNPHEAALLKLDSKLANIELNWRSHWPLEHALSQTVAWHKAWLRKENMMAVSIEQIRAYAQTDIG